MASSAATTAAWASAWSGPAEVLADRYRPDAVLVELGDDPTGRTRLEGRGAIAAHAADGLYRVPDRTVSLRRRLDGDADGAVVVAEWLFTGRGAQDLVTMAVPGATWWRLDGEGAIAEEVRVLRWSQRRILDDEVRGAPRPVADGPERSHGWYRDFVARLFEVLDFDPDLAARAMYADIATALDAVAAPAAADTGRPATGRSATGRLRPGALVGERGTFAVRLDDGEGPAAIVLADLDHDDRIVHERRYGGGWWPGAAPG